MPPILVPSSAKHIATQISADFADFVRFRQYTYARTQQSLPPLWVAMNKNTHTFCIATSECKAQFIETFLMRYFLYFIKKTALRNTTKYIEDTGMSL